MSEPNYEWLRDVPGLRQWMENAVAGDRPQWRIWQAEDGTWSGVGKSAVAGRTETLDVSFTGEPTREAAGARLQRLVQERCREIFGSVQA